MKYAIIFNLKNNVIKKSYPPNTYSNPYNDIGDVLKQFGFIWEQANVYFGDENIDAVTCVLAIQALSLKFSWFKDSVLNISMLRIDEINDLKPAL